MANPLLSGLMAGANFGTGYYQGQDQALQYKMNQLAYQNAQLQEQQNKMRVQQQQNMMDFAMQNFPTTITNPINGQPINAPQGGNPTPGPGAGGPPPPPADPMESLMSNITMGVQQDQAMAEHARASGDLDDYDKYSTKATSGMEALSTFQNHQDSAKLAELKRQELAYSAAAGYFQGIPDTEDAYKKAQGMALQDPRVISNPDEVRNLASIPYHPGVADTIARGGMTAAQQATDQYRQAMLDSTKQMREAEEQDRKQTATDRKDSLDFRKQVHQDAMAAKGKEGSIPKVPSTEDLSMASPIIQRIMFPNGNVNQKDPDFIQARDTITSRAMGLMQQNKGMNITQAVALAAEQAKNSGEFPSTPTKQTTMFGVPIPGTKTEGKTSFTPKGDTPDTAIPLVKGMKASDLVKEKYYQTKMGTGIWTGTGFQMQQ